MNERLFEVCKQENLNFPMVIAKMFSCSHRGTVAPVRHVLGVPKLSTDSFTYFLSIFYFIFFKLKNGRANVGVHFLMFHPICDSNPYFCYLMGQNNENILATLQAPKGG